MSKEFAIFFYNKIVVIKDAIYTFLALTNTFHSDSPIRQYVAD